MMGSDGADVGAFADSVVFLSYFSDLPDPRQRAKVRYPLDEVPLLFLLAVIAGADCIVEIARFGQKKRDLLRRFRPLLDGTPSHDQLGDILASLDPQAFQRCFVAWVASLTGVEPDVIAANGKALRRSSYRKADTILALKANQESLHDDIALFVREQKARDFSDAVTSRDTTA